MIKTITANLRRIEALAELSSADYSDDSIGPYHSSVGNHVRHVLDMFNSVTEGLAGGHVDLTKRVRGVACETDISEALMYMRNVIAEVESLEAYDKSLPLELVDDLGDGNVTTNSTLGSVLAQAHSHAIHHFAIIGYLLHNHRLSLPDIAFGYNPTTPLN